MPEYERRTALAAGTPVRVQIRAADPGERHVENYLAVAWFWPFDILDAELVAAEPDECMHPLHLG